MLMMSWTLAICQGKKVGAYLSDISGAFDKVFKEYMMGKLHNAGVGPLFWNFLSSYLEPRRGQVAVAGTLSNEIELTDTVFQGTVLGPPLWNTFFADVAESASSTGGREALFADDLNVFQEFARHTPLTQIQSELEQCRGRVHTWGRKNRVGFDASKEHILVLHPSSPHGAAFKLLGLMTDPDLRMHSAIDQLLSRIRPKVTAILRTRAYYSVPQLIDQFKTHIWGLIECNSGGYFHAANSLLVKVDKVQTRFLKELDLTEEQAFLDFNFAPCRVRRNIAILGLIHKRVLGKCHPSYDRLLPFSQVNSTRANAHDKQLYGHWCEITSHQALFNKSILLMVDTHNFLEQSTVNAKTVSIFQSKLIQIVRARCEQHDAEWRSSFCPRGATYASNSCAPDLD